MQMSKLGVRKQVDQGQVRKKQQDKPKEMETMRRGPLKSKAGFTLYTHCSDTVKQTKPPVHKSVAGCQKQTQGKDEAEDQLLQQPDVVSQMQIQNAVTRPGDVSSIMIPTGDIDSSGDGTWFGHLDLPEFGTPFNKRLISSTPDPESLLEADLLEHHMNQPSLMCPQVIPERDTTHPTKPTDVLATAASNLSEKLKIQRQQFQQNQQLLQQKQGQQPHNQCQQQTKKYQNPMSLKLQDDGTDSQKLIHQQVVPSRELPRVVPTSVPGANSVGGHEHLKRHKPMSTSVDCAIQTQPVPAMGQTSSSLHHGSCAVVSKKSIRFEIADDTGSVRTKGTYLGSPVSKVTIVSRPENSQPCTISSSSQPSLTNDNINNCQFVKTASPKYKNVSDKAVENCSSSIKDCETAMRVLDCFDTTSAFPKPQTYTGTKNCVAPSYLESSTLKEIPFPDLGSNSVKNNVPDTKVSELSVPEEANQNILSHNLSEVNYVKSYLVKEIKHNYTTQMTGDPNIGGKTSPAKSKTATAKDPNISTQSGAPNKTRYSVGNKTENSVEFTAQPGHLNNVCIASPLKSQDHNTKIEEGLRNSQLNKNIQNEDSINTSTDICDLEVNNVLKKCKSDTDDNSKKGNAGLSGKMDNKNEDDGRMSVASVSSNLSHVIELLKTDAFNQPKEKESGVLSISGNKDTDDKNDDKEDTENKNTDTIPAAIPDTLDKQHGDSEALAALMQQYLPGTVQKNESNDDSKHDYTCFNSNAKSKDQDVGVCDRDSKSKDPPDGNFDEVEADLNVNQNYFHDDDSDYEVLIPRKRKNLQYLQRMADPALRDVTCKLALKATALRDMELRDLIDEMILLTDASLRHEDARFQSARMFFAEENNKLKKRIQTINQQLDAKERQERQTTLGHSDYDVLHLERKLMYLRDEKEKLDHQVTSLLEEKAQWLITQQSLVRTLSLKDHELLKLEEKHHEEKKSLLQSLEQATQNSQGVHYKLSVADKEISNLEQCIKSRNVEIMNLKDKLKKMEERLQESERHSKFKSQEILHLHDVVDALKIGVGHVLQAYESSCNKDTKTAEQRQGMENLRKIVHPEEYRNKLNGPDVATQRQIPTRGPHHYRHTFLSSQTSTVPKESQEYHPSSLTDRLYQRHHSLEDGTHRTDHYRQHRSRDDERDMFPQRLTSETLKEHDKRFSPVNKLLWRSLDNAPRRALFEDYDPYYSDSEIEINGRCRRRTSFHRHGTTAGNLHQQFKPSLQLPHEHSQTRREWHRRDDDDWHIPRRSLNTTLASETVPKSRDIYAHSLTDNLSEDTYYSTLRSESIPGNQCMPEQKHGQMNLVEESCQPRSPSQRQRQKNNINRKNPQLHSLRQEHEHIPRFALPENSLDFNDRDEHLMTLRADQDRHFQTLRPDQDGHFQTLRPNQDGHFQTLRPDQDGHFQTLRPDHLSLSGYGSFDRDAQTFPKTLHEDLGSSHPLYIREHPFTTMDHTDRNQPVENREASFYKSQPHHSFSGRHTGTTQFNDSLERPSSSRQSVLSTDVHSIINESASFSDISLSRGATKNSDNVTQREFFQGTELSGSLSTISEIDVLPSNNNQLMTLSEDPFSSGIASLDEKIADLQRKIDRTKALYS